MHISVFSVETAAYIEEVAGQVEATFTGTAMAICFYYCKVVKN